MRMDKTRANSPFIRVREAVEELWGKMVDMQKGRPLSEAEWQMVLKRLEELLAEGMEDIGED